MEQEIRVKKTCGADNVALAGILLWPAQLSIELFICELPKM